jgi:hypothetical protein
MFISQKKSEGQLESKSVMGFSLKTTKIKNRER